MTKCNLGKLLIFLICLTNSLMGQSNRPAVADPYKNFVGNWVGQSRYIQDGTPKSDLIELTVTELPKGKGMRFDYTYSKPGEPAYSKSTRYMRFKEGKKAFQIILHWETSTTDNIYESGDMQQFVQNGFGTFSMTERPVDMQGQRPYFRGTFQLAPDKLVYEWEGSADGKKFYPTSYFQFTRKMSDNTPAPANPIKP